MYLFHALEKYFTFVDTSPVDSFLVRDGRRVRWGMHNGKLYLSNDSLRSVIPMDCGPEDFVARVIEAFETITDE